MDSLKRAAVLALLVSGMVRCQTTIVDDVDPRMSNCTEDCGNSSSSSAAGSVNDTMDEEEAIAMHIQHMYMNIMPDWWEWILIGMHVIVFTIGLVGNSLVVIAVYRNHSMRTVTNYFIVNLALADLLVIIICLPPSVLWDVTETWFFGQLPCKIVLYLQTVSVTVSVLTLVSISLDRWYAICSPFTFKSTTKRAKKIIFLIWVAALILDVPDLIAMETYSAITRPKLASRTIIYMQCGLSWSRQSQLYFAILKFCLLYVFPLSFISVAYYQIAWRLWSGEVPGHNLTKRVLSSQTSMGNQEGQLHTRRKAAKMLAAVVGVFALCCLPVHIFIIVRLTTMMHRNQWLNALSCIIHWLFYANSAINPLIYNFMSGKFRKEFRRTFCCPRSGGSYTRAAYQDPAVSRNHRPASMKSTSFNNSMNARSTLAIFSNNNNNVRHSTETVPLSTVCSSPSGFQQQTKIQ